MNLRRVEALEPNSNLNRWNPQPFPNISAPAPPTDRTPVKDVKTDGRTTMQPWLYRALRQNFNVRSLDYRPIAGGYCATTFHVTARADRRIQQFAVKTSLRGSDHQWSLDVLAEEASPWGLLNLDTPQTPNLTAVLHDPQSSDVGYVYTWLDGVPLLNLYGTEIKPTPAVTDSLNFLVNHRRIWKNESVSASILPQYSPYGGYIPSMETLESLTATFQNHRIRLPTKMWDTLLDSTRNVTTGMCATTVCHRDFHPGNVLCDPATGEFVGIVDWGKACAGPVDVDIARMGISSHLWGDEPSAEKVWGEFCGGSYRWDYAATTLLEMGTMWPNWVAFLSASTPHAETPTELTVAKRWVDLATFLYRQL